MRQPAVSCPCYVGKKRMWRKLGKGRLIDRLIDRLLEEGSVKNGLAGTIIEKSAKSQRAILRQS